MMNPQTPTPALAQAPLPAQPSTNKRLLVGGALVLGVIMAIFIVVAIALSGSDYSAQVADLSAQQIELKRVADDTVGEKGADPVARNLAATVSSLAGTYISDLTPLGGGFEVEDELIESYTDESVDVALADAVLNGDHLEVLSGYMTTMIEETLTKVDALRAKLSGEDLELLERMAADYRLMLDLFKG